MLKQLLCWLKTEHKNRRVDGSPFKKQVWLNKLFWFMPYRCRACFYKGHEKLWEAK